MLIVSNTGKGSGTNPKKINVTKSDDNGEILTLDNEIMSRNLVKKVDLLQSNRITYDLISKKKS